jgi:uncharacterized membrane protein
MHIRVARSGIEEDMKPYVTVGLTALAAAAVFEVALVPAVVVGGAAMLAPRYLSKYLPTLRPRVGRAINTAARRPAKPAAGPAHRPDGDVAQSILPKLSIGQSIAKTITFRLVVTTLDFTTNFLVIGEVTTAAGLSTFNFIAGPLFYLSHEAAWNYLDPAEAATDSSLPMPTQTDEAAKNIYYGGLAISRALAKTITYRAIATVMDFTTNYVVVRNVTEAAILSASGFVLGPFVYFGHEKAWEYFTSRRPQRFEAPAEMKLLPAR